MVVIPSTFSIQNANKEVSGFLEEWYDDNDCVLVHTSGSTGVPKPMWIEKRRMLASARVTCDFLQLRAGHRALLCLPLQFIAGKMMVVRALERQLCLLVVEPDGHPLASIDCDNSENAIDFAAMVAMQVYNSLQVAEERRRLKSIRHLIIGGSAIDDGLAAELRDFPNAVWSTYGMTETLSHIALRRLNGEEASEWYTPLADVSVSLNEEHCLVIHAPQVCDKTMVTNDIAELESDGRRFRIIGRKDNVICSGGIKLQIEDIEKTLKSHMPVPFMVTKKKDVKYGEIVVLVYHNSDNGNGHLGEVIEQICQSHLPKYWQPRRFLAVESLPVTANGKPARRQAECLAAQMP